ncbi:MAG: VOC family protein [Chitinophagaceae bacterium]|nr:VOC family protein [Chitinophagaceae bacterium]
MQLPLLQTMLGEVTAFTINSPDPEVSLQFYQKLGFREVIRSDFPFPFIQITDDAILIMLRKSDEPYLALTYYTNDSGKIVLELEARGIQFISSPNKGDFVKRYLFQSPDGANISLVEIPELFAKPPGKTMINMNQADYFKPETYTNKVAGMFGEYAQPVEDLERSIAFWEKIGYTLLSKYTEPQPWAILSDGSGIAGLHQSKEFSSASITFFAADMKSKLENLKKQGLTFKEINPANAILTTPENQQLFLFNFGM